MIIAILLVQLKEQRNSKELTGTVTGILLFEIDPEDRVYFQMFPEQFLFFYSIRCRNGFNRRDEAIKHYRTHFRNPQTTFQIQITRVVFLFQEINTKRHSWVTNLLVSLLLQLLVKRSQIAALLRSTNVCDISFIVKESQDNVKYNQTMNGRISKFSNRKEKLSPNTGIGYIFVHVFYLQEVNQDHYETDNAASTITHISHDDGTEGIISSSPISGASSYEHACR